MRLAAAVALALVTGCGSSAPPAAIEPATEAESPFDQRNTALRDELGALIAPGKTTAEYSALRGSFHHRIRVPYKDILEATAKLMEGTWEVEVRAKSERDKDRIESLYVKALPDQQTAERAAALLLELRDHHGGSAPKPVVAPVAE